MSNQNQTCFYCTHFPTLCFRFQHLFRFLIDSLYCLFLIGQSDNFGIGLKIFTWELLYFEWLVLLSTDKEKVKLTEVFLPMQHLVKFPYHISTTIFE